MLLLDWNRDCDHDDKALMDLPSMGRKKDNGSVFRGSDENQEVCIRCRNLLEVIYTGRKPRHKQSNPDNKLSKLRHKE